MVSVSSAVLGSSGFLMVFSALKKMKELCILQFTLELGIFEVFLEVSLEFFG